MVLPLRLIVVSVALIGCTTKPSGEVNEPPSTTSVSAIEAEPELGPDPRMDPAEPMPPPDETIEVDGVRIGLAADACMLSADIGEQRFVHVFEFPAKCSFVADSSGAIRIVETDSGKAVMVESSKPLERDCDTATRVVVITPEGPRVSKAVQRMAMCAPFDWDEMMFHVLASEPVAFGVAGAEP